MMLVHALHSHDSRSALVSNYAVGSPPVVTPPAQSSGCSSLGSSSLLPSGSAVSTLSSWLA